MITLLDSAAQVCYSPPMSPTYSAFAICDKQTGQPVDMADEDRMVQLEAIATDRDALQAVIDGCGMERDWEIRPVQITVQAATL